jgi:hypothetical protein
VAKSNRKQGGRQGAATGPGASGQGRGRSGNPAVRAGSRQPAGRPKGSRHAAGASGGRGTTPRRPLPPGETLYTPGAGPTRRRIERTSAPLVVYLHQLPRMVPVAALVILLVLGALLPPALAAIPIGLAVLFLGWLSYLSWPAISGSAKVTRLSIIAFLVGLAVYRFFG